MIGRRALLRVLLAFLAALVFWSVFSHPYEGLMAGAAEPLIRAFERPAVTRLQAVRDGFRVERRDLPPGSPRPGLPAPDIHFNFVLLVSLFALDPRPWEIGRFTRFLLALLLLFLVHVLALVLQVQSVYATSMGPWSRERYGAVARNVWGGAFHFYLIAGRFAAPFVIWWPLRRAEQADEKAAPRRPGSGRRRRRRAKAAG